MKNMENNAIRVILIGSEFLEENINNSKEYVLTEIKYEFAKKSDEKENLWEIKYKKKDLIPLEENVEIGKGGELRLKISLEKRKIVNHIYDD